MKFYTIDGTGRLLGWTIGPGALPNNTANRQYIEATPTRESAVNARTAQAKSEERDAVILYDSVADVFSLAPDSRPFFRVTTDKTQIAADGIDTATVTVTSLLPDATTNTSLNGPVILSTQSGRRFLLNFVDGVAVKQFKTTQSGEFDVTSTNEYKLEAPMAIVAVE